MKIYEFKKEIGGRSLLIFGIPVMKQIYDFKSDQKYQEILGSLVTTVKIKNKKHDGFNKEIKIFGKSVVKRIDENDYRIYSFLGKEYRKISLLKEFKQSYFKYFNKEHDDIYILRANSGDIYLALTYFIDLLIKKNGSKKPLLLATKKYHIDLIKMICPDLPYVYIKKINLKVIGDTFKIDNFRFFVLYSSVLFRKVELALKNDELETYHYFKFYLENLSLPEKDLQMRKINTLHDAEQSMLEKIDKTGLNLNKFVFLAPEAQSCELYDENFWCLLINKLQKIGCDVFVNLNEKNINLKNAIDFKTCDLTFAEAFALAKKAKKIVSLRSGFTEFLLQTNVPIDVLYTKFKYVIELDISRVMSAFRITQIPFVDTSKIQEFNMYEVSQKYCIEKILTPIL